MPAAPIDQSSSETVAALRNAFTLGLSLIATWGVALLVRLYLPRHLGPELFGTFTFADSFAATFLIVVDLGFDTYIRKEIPVRPEHASDFFGSIAVVRALLMLGLLAAMTIFLELTGRPLHVQILVALFGVAHFATSLNSSLAALLHSVGTVGGLALLNVASKLLWGAGVVVAVVTHFGLAALAGAYLLSEVVRGVALLVLTRKHVNLRFTWDVAAMKTVILASLPFYLSAIAYTAYGRLDVSMLAMLVSDLEAGWYGAALNFAGLALLLSPLIGWVLLPVFSRAAARSEEELFALIRQSLFAILMLAVPVSLFMSLGADVWVAVMFGDAFLPAVPSLRVLASMFILSYVAMILATCLIRLERAWTVTGISVASLVVLPIMNWLILPRAGHWFGPGGAALGAAAVLMFCETGIAVAFAVAVGRRAFFPMSFSKLAKMIATCLAVTALDVALRPLGPARLVISALAYVGLLLALRVVHISDGKRVLKLMRERRLQSKEAPAARPPQPSPESAPASGR